MRVWVGRSVGVWSGHVKRHVTRNALCGLPSCYTFVGSWALVVEPDFFRTEMTSGNLALKCICHVSW